MLWWDDLMKNLVAMNSNNYTQEGQVEGQVNDQVANDQNEGSQKGDQRKGQSKTKHTYTLEGGKLTFRGFTVKVGNSQRISGRLRFGKLDGELDKVASKEDLQKLVDKIAGNGNDYSQMTEEDLRRKLYQDLAALVRKTNKSIEGICEELQAGWKKLEELRKKRSTAAEALAECDQELEHFGF